MFTPRLLKIKIHTRRVLIFKRSLPVFAFLLASLIFIWPTVFSTKEQFALVVDGNGGAKGSKVDMEQVRFFAQDDKNQPMTLIAQKIQETDPKKRVVFLETLAATYKTHQGVLLNSQTAYGFAFQKEEYLYFEDKIHTTSDNGYTIASSRVFYDYRDGALESDSAVSIRGPAGTLQAEGFILYNKGDNIDFKEKTDTLIRDAQGDVRVQSRNGLLIDQAAQTVTALGKVIITQQETTLTADKVVLSYYTAQQNKDERIAKIEAFGAVTAANAAYKMTGDTGVYHPRTKLVSMKGNVKLYQGNNLLTGEAVAFNLETGVAQMDTPQAENGRVRGEFMPAELQKGTE